MNTTSTSIRLVIADDHVVLTQSLTRLFDAQPDMTVVGQAPDTDATLALVEEHEPDVLVLDLTMPCLDGYGASRGLESPVVAAPARVFAARVSIEVDPNSSG